MDLRGGERYSDNVLNLWRENMSVSQFTRSLDKIDPKTSIQILMVQCFSGGFAQVNQIRGKVIGVSSPANRCGFFSQTSNLPASGCFYDLSNTEEYSIYFFRAHEDNIADFNKDGVVGADEAHHYVLRNLSSPDRPLTTSQHLLRQIQSFGENIQQDSPKKLLGGATELERQTITFLAGQLDVDLNTLKSLHDLRKQQGKVISSWLKLTNSILSTLGMELIEKPKHSPSTNSKIEETFEFQELREYLLDRFSILNYTMPIYSLKKEQTTVNGLDPVLGAIENHRYFKKLKKMVLDQKVAMEENMHKWALAAKLERMIYLLETIGLRTRMKSNAHYTNINQKYEQLLKCEREPFFLD